MSITPVKEVNLLASDPLVLGATGGGFSRLLPRPATTRPSTTSHGEQLRGVPARDDHRLPGRTRLGPGHRLGQP